MALGDPSVKKKLKANLKEALKDWEKKAKVLGDALEERYEICKDYQKAKKNFDNFVDKNFGVDHYQALMQGRVQPTADERALIQEAFKLDDIGTAMVQANDSALAIMMDSALKAVAAARKATDAAADDVRRAKKALNDYIDKKADLKNKGQKAEYAQWKKTLREELFVA